MEAGWHPDPHGRFELRYHDGERWTEHVSDAGQVATDPPEPSGPPAPAGPPSRGWGGFRPAEPFVPTEPLVPAEPVVPAEPLVPTEASAPPPVIPPRRSADDDEPLPPSKDPAVWAELRPSDQEVRAQRRAPRRWLRVLLVLVLLAAVAYLAYDVLTTGEDAAGSPGAVLAALLDPPG